MRVKKDSMENPAWATSSGSGASYHAEEGVSEVGISTEEHPPSGETGDPLAYWKSASLAELVDHLCADHARWTTTELPFLEDLAFRANDGVSPANPSLAPIAAGLARLRTALTGHLQGEEQVLFPAAVALERAVETGSPLERPSFGSIRNPVSMLTRDHDEELSVMEDLRGFCEQHNLAAESGDLRHLDDGLRDLQTALDLHCRIENEVLFPRVIELENTAKRVRKASQ